MSSSQDQFSHNLKRTNKQGKEKVKETDHKFKKPCPAQQQQKTTTITSPCLLNHLTSHHMHKQMPSTYNFSPASVGKDPCDAKIIQCISSRSQVNLPPHTGTMIPRQRKTWNPQSAGNTRQRDRRLFTSGGAVPASGLLLTAAGFPICTSSGKTFNDLDPLAVLSSDL